MLGTSDRGALTWPKRCSVCRRNLQWSYDKTLSDFYVVSKRRRRTQPEAACKACVSAAGKARRERSESVYERTWKLRNRYNLSPEQWDAQHLAQDGMCAECGKPETGKVRGVLRSLSVRQAERGGEFTLVCSKCRLAVHYQRMSGPLIPTTQPKDTPC